MQKALQFHRITPEFQFCGTWHRPAQFESFLEFMATQKIKMVLPEEANGGIIMTFDDGEENLYHHAFPILKKWQVKALIFLVVKYIGKKNFWDISPTGKRIAHLSWAQVLEMKKWGMEFGSHTMTHRNLAQLSVPELEYELNESKRILEKNLGKIDSISYPFNRTSPLVLKKVSEAGYQYGFGGNGQNRLLIKKEAFYITDNLRTLKVKIFEKPRFVYQYERLKQKLINYCTLATMLKTPKYLNKIHHGDTP